MTELATRIKDCKPSVIISTSAGVDGSKVVPYKPLLDAAINMIKDDHLVMKTIICQRDVLKCDLVSGRDTDWTMALKKIPDSIFVPCESMNATDPLYILYTSGNFIPEGNIFISLSTPMRYRINHFDF